jgi:HlyD family secretion protein
MRDKKVIEMKRDVSMMPANQISGAGMDTAIGKKRPYGLWIKGFVLAITLVIATGILISEFGSAKTYRAEQDQVKVAIVETGTFEDFINIRGRVVPKTTVYLDAMEDGRVEKILVEYGAIVEQGDLIAVLSSPSLQLSVNTNQAEVIGRLNTIRQIELDSEQSLFTYKHNLVEIDYAIKKLTKNIKRQKKLLAKQVIAERDLIETEDELAYLNKRRQIIIDSQAIEMRIQKQQLAFSQESIKQLEEGLRIVKKNLDSLQVRAPVSGKLSGFDIEIGQSISSGARLGQVDSLKEYKVTNDMDEFYLDRVDLGQNAVYVSEGKEYVLEVNKIYPQVTKGRFKVDFRFVNGIQPKSIRRGQSVAAKLTLSDPTQSLIIPNGSFYSDTGGQWIFVLNKDENKAIKRKISIGRRNINKIEIVGGLEKGEKVIISDYKSFLDMERIIINAK